MPEGRVVPRFLYLVSLISLGFVSVTHAAGSGVYVLKSADLAVTVDRAFPRVISYKHLASGEIFNGQGKAVSAVILNRETYTPMVKSKGPGRFRNQKDPARYELTFPDAGQVKMVATLSVEGSVLTFKITEVVDSEAFLVNTLEFPNLAMISVSSAQSGAALAAATIHADKAKQMDDFIEITRKVTARKQNAAYAILNTDTLAATLVNNSAYDIDKNDVRPKGVKKDKTITLGNGRVRVAIESENRTVSAGLSNGEWTYRARESSITADELWCKVIITTDRNQDGELDWQDGAIAYRDIMEDPFKAEMTPKRVAQHISFNFASQAGEPFLRALDNVKRVHYATDGLGQFVLLKGYQSEGHDSAHPDYGGNIGRRQGGKEDMNVLIDTAGEWNAEIGVHINCQEAYPEAYTFESDMVYTNRRGWNWIDQSYIINHRWDITSGAFEKRVQHMMEDVPGLDFIYMDVYWGDGWLSQEFERIFRRAGLGITTEFPMMLEHAATWSHWSTDMRYGPDRSRGINSHIIRFIRNHQKDTYLQHPLLGHAELGDFEGWQGRTDFNEFLGKLYGSSLPSKYLQHYEIQKWTEHEVLLGDTVRVTDESGQRQFLHNGRVVLDGSVYLLPWEPATERKLYHWSEEGGESTWVLPPSWETDSVKLYELTHTGRRPAIDVPVVDGEITLTAQAKTPYVVYPSEAPALPAPDWGEASSVEDPSFYDTTLSAWTVEAAEGAVSVVADDHLRTALTIGKSDSSTIVSQMIGLDPGVYSASVWVEVDEPGRKASLTVSVAGGDTSTVWTDQSPLEATACNMHWNRTRMQRMRVVFEVIQGAQGATLELGVAPGTTRVRFDDIRVVSSVFTEKDGYDLWEDFEHIDEGWFPFVKGTAGGINDPRTHLSERHHPFTDKGWNNKLIDDTLEGDWALKSHSERLGPGGKPGLIYRTIPQTLRFEPGKTYEVSFDYQCVYDGEYEFLIGSDEAGESTLISNIPFMKTEQTERFVVTVEPGNKKSVWIGVQRMQKNDKKRPEADLVIDNLGVRQRTK